MLSGWILRVARPCSYDLLGGRLGERQAVPVRVQHDDVAHTVAVGLHRFVVDAVRSEPGQDAVEAGHTERDHRLAHPLGPYAPIVDDDPRVLTDLPQLLLADDLV